VGPVDVVAERTEEVVENENDKVVVIEAEELDEENKTVVENVGVAVVPNKEVLFEVLTELDIAGGDPGLEKVDDDVALYVILDRDL